MTYLLASSPTVARILAVASLVLLAYSAKSAVDTRYPEPEDGAVANGVFHDEYFGLSYPLPSGWAEDLKGPEPSAAGDYSLAALKPQAEMSATIQISAQDNFFAANPADNATDFLVRMKQHLDESLSAPDAVGSIVFGGQHFARLDYYGAGLYHSVFATELRCHTLIFTITSGGAEAIAGIAESLKKMTFSQNVRPQSSSQSEPAKQWPLCLSDSEYSDHVARRVTPAMVGPRYGSVPVRLLIGPDGKIEHIHAIAGVPEQIKSVTEALARWEFKPYILDNQPVEVETGILFEFPQPPAQRTAK
jgi:hypothetical protein